MAAVRSGRRGAIRRSALERRLQEAALASRRLVFYQGVVDSHPVVRPLVQLVRALAQPETDASSDVAADTLWQTARALAGSLLADWRGLGQHDAAPPWQDGVLDAVLTDDNPFARAAASVDRLEELPPAVRGAAAADLRRLQSIATLLPHELETALQARGVPWPGGLWAWGLPSDEAELRPRRDLVEAVRCKWRVARDWGESLEELAAYYRLAGPGVVGRYAVLRWDGAALTGVAHPDPVRLEHLVGYERERAQVVRNTERLLEAGQAHHLLLYGPRGTGKSATVKALAAAFHDRGLRLVEVPVRHISSLPRLLAMLRGYRQRFVVFVDDVSFEDAHGSFKELKAILEGSAEPCPANVRVYATSNRRHLVRERHGGDETARPSDERNEELSLADRFGITVFFPACDQELYLCIVEALARRAGIRVVDGADGDAGLADRTPGASIDRSTLRQRALQWALHHDGPSPRTAAQLVTELAGELAGGRP